MRSLPSCAPRFCACSARAILAVALAACSAPPAPVIDHRHPASIDAAESPVRPPRRALRADEATLRTRDLLARRAAEAATAADESPAASPDTTPPAGGHSEDHAHHH